MSQQGKRIFSSKGQFTKNTFEAKKHAEVAQRQATSRAEFVASNLQRSLDNIVDGTESAEVVERVQKSLNSNTSFLDIWEPEERVKAFADEFNLPLDVSENVLKARELLDEMTGKFDNVSIPTEIREAMSNNIGQYLRRSYRLFEDPNYRPPALLEKKAFDYFNNININRGMSVEKAQDEALKTVKSLITRNEKAPNDHFERLTKLNRAMFRAKKTDEELPEVIREFMGEIKDPVESVLISITKASKFYENLKFYETFNNLGKKGGYVFTNRTLPKSGDSTQTRKFQEQNFMLIENTNSVLDGKYTTKEMYSALMQREEHFATISENKIYQKFLTGKGMTQAAKTVGSISTHVRNVSGGAQIALANGILPFGSGTDAVKIIYAGVRKQGDEALVAKYDEYLGLGIINTSVKMNEFRKLIAAGFDGDYRGVAQRIEDSAKASEPQLTGAIDKALNKAQGALGEGAGKIIESPVGRLTNKIVEGAEEIYMGVDDFYKIHAYEKELDYLRKALPDAPEEVLRQEAADLIKSTFPTYDRVPPGIKAIRELPLGNFVAFPAEIIRTSGNILRRASKEITSGNTVLRNRGLQRLAGFSVSAGAYSGAAYQGAAALGWTEEQREGAEVLAETPWSKYSTRIFTSLNDELVSIDTQFLDSYSTVKEPLFAFVGEIKEGTLRGDDLDKKIFEASKGSLQTLLSPYFSESMLTTVIADVGYAALSEDGRGRKGERYFTQEQDMLDRSGAVFLDVLKTFVPGTFTTAYNIREAVMEIPRKGGETIRYRDTAQELYKAGLGINFSPFEPEKKLYYAGAAYARRENLIGAPKPDWTKDGKKLLKEHRLLEKARFENSQELYRIYQSAVKYYGPDNIGIALTQLKEGGVPKKVLNSVVAGSFIPKDPSQDRMYKIQKKTSLLESGESTVNAYYRQINDMMYLSLEHSFDRQVAEKEERRRKKNKGGEVLNVPNASPEPDQRIDKMTGRPYDQQAGAAFTDQEDRQDPLQRMGFGAGGSVQDPLRRMGFGKGSKVRSKLNNV